MGLFDDGNLHNNRFLFLSVGILRMGFSKISNLSHSAEVETIQEGGYNDGPRFFVKPRTNTETLVLEHGVKALSLTDRMQVGNKIYLGMILVMDGALPVKVLHFEYGVVTKLEYGELNALSKEVFIRKMEITHTGLIEE